MPALQYLPMSSGSINININGKLAVAILHLHSLEGEWSLIVHFDIIDVRILGTPSTENHSRDGINQLQQPVSTSVSSTYGWLSTIRGWTNHCWVPCGSICSCSLEETIPIPISISIPLITWAWAYSRIAYSAFTIQGGVRSKLDDSAIGTVRTSVIHLAQSIAHKPRTDVMVYFRHSSTVTLL
jgi:hypothetical protein